MGAVEVPTYTGKWPGNIDGVVKLAHSMNTGYIGALLWSLLLVMVQIVINPTGEPIKQMAEELGSTIFMFPLMWKKQVFTVEPDHIKVMLLPGIFFPALRFSI